MSFPVQCPNCNTKLKAKDRHIGKELGCPKCKQPFVVEAPEPEAAEPTVEAPEEAQDSLMDADIDNLNSGDLGFDDGDFGDLSSGVESGSDDLDGVDRGSADFSDNGIDGLESASSGSPSPYLQQTQWTTQSSGGGMSRRTILLIVGGGVGTLFLLVGIVLLVVWLFTPSSEPGEEHTAQTTPTAQDSPPASDTATDEPAKQQTPAPPIKETASPAAGQTWQDLVQSENANGNEVYASFTPEVDGVRNLVLATSEQKKFELCARQTHVLPEGTGLQLVGPPRWVWEPAPVAEPDLIDKAVDGDGYRLVRLRPFGTPFVPTIDRHKDSEIRSRTFRSDHKHLWSKDGKWLYVLAGNSEYWKGGPRHLLKVNAENWKVELRVVSISPSRKHIEDISWCADGLIMVITGGGHLFIQRDSESDLWFPLMTGQRSSSTLVLVDPDTFLAKRAWSVPRLHQVAGTVDGDLVYAVSSASNCAMINIKTGQLMNLHHQQLGFRRPVVTPDGKWLVAGGPDGLLNLYKISGVGLVLDEHRYGSKQSVAVISPDGTNLTFRGRDKFYAIETEDLNKTVGSVSGPENGKLVVDPVTKIAYVCGRDEATNALKLRIMKEDGHVEVALDEKPKPDPNEEKKTGRQPATGTLPRGTEFPEALKGQVPFAMSAAPQGRGAIAFAEEAAYWIETRTKGKNWAFSSEEATEVSAVEELADTSAEDARLALPKPIERPFEIRAVNDDAPGRSFQLPRGHFFRELDVDARSGDIAVFSGGGDGDLKGSWLYIFQASQIESDTLRPKAALPFEAPHYISLRFKQFGKKTLLLVARNDVLWVLNPQTLQLADVEGAFHNRIDLRSEQYDSWLRPPRDPRARQTKKPDGSYAIYTSRDADDPMIVLGRGRFIGREQFHMGYQINLVSGEIDKTMQVPRPQFSNPASIGHDGAIQDPYEELSVQQGGVTRDGVTAKWSVRTSQHQSLGILEKRPWIVTRDMTHVHFYSRHDLSDSVDVEFPSLLTMRSGIPQTVVCDDAGHDQLIFGGNPSVFEHKEDKWGVVWILPLSAAKIPDRPFLVARLDMPESIEPGAPVSIPIHVPDSRVRVSVAEGPDGARVTDGKLEWTPKREDVGTHELVLRLRAGTTSVERKYPYTVSYPELPLDSPVASVHISLDGRLALAWNYMNIAIVDVRERKVLAKRKVNQRLLKAVLADERAFLLYADGHTVEECGLDDLNPVETLYFTGAIRNIDVLNDRFLFFATGEGKRALPGSLGKFHVLELPGLNETQLTKVLSGSPPRDRISQTTNGWLVGPAILDERLQKIVSLSSIGWANPFYVSAPSPDIGASVIQNRSSRSTTILAGGGSKPTATASLAGGALNITASMDPIDPRTDRWVVKLVLAFTRAGEDAEAVQVPIAKFKANHSARILVASGKGVAIAASGKLFTLFPGDFGIQIPPAPEATELTLRAKVPLTALTAAKNAELRFVADGGKPPYEYNCQLKLDSRSHVPGGQNSQDQLLQVNARNGSVTIDGSLLVEALLSSTNSFRLSRSLYEFAKRNAPGTSAAEFVDQYTQQVSKDLQPPLRKPLRGFPVVVPLLVSATDAESQEVKLSHEVFLELPREKIIQLLDGQFSRDSGSTAKQPLDRLGIPDPVHSRAFFAPAPDLPLIWNGGTTTDIANELRRLWPPVSIDDPEWSAQRLAAACAIIGNHRQLASRRQPSQGVNLPERTWKTTDGKEVTGQLCVADEHRISVQAEDERSGHRLDISTLDEESLQHAWIDVQRLRQPREFRTRPPTRPGTKPDVKTHELGRAIAGFYNHYGCLPPRAIVDDSGQPLLSWRVLLLPYFGHSKLFHLFHLDEPWDSEHNKKLIPYMPFTYNPTQTGLPLGRTTFKALSGPRAVFPHEGLRRYHDFEHSPSDALLIVEVDKKAAVEWTKPDDLDMTDDETWKDQLYKRELDGVEYFHGLSGNGELYIIPVKREEP